MATFEDTKALALRELDGCRRLLEGASTWDTATVCEGWDLDALARHVAAVTWQQAEAFHRARVLVTEAPSWLQVSGPRDEVLAALDEDRAHLADAFTRVVDEQRTVPLPFAPLPASIAAAALVLEYGVHRADLQRAIDGAPDDTLDPEVASVIAPLLPALIPVLAQKDPGAPITYRLVGNTTTASISWHEGTWRSDEGNEPVCEVRGTDAAISLLALGRIGVDHPSLAVSDPAGAAAALSDHIRPL
jgi:uncharacterized protein (TIGR03083 family)